MKPPVIHPAAIVEDGAQLGAGCVVHAGAILRRGVILGENVTVHPYAVLGGDPQDLHFDPATVSGVRLGAGTVVREHATVNRSTKPDGFTEIGADCFLMAGAHVAHDGRIGDRVVLANNVMVAGHVAIGSHAFLGGGVGVHQFCRVGESVMVAGLARIALDLPPFVLAAERNEISGLNLVGLRRRGFPREVVAELKECFRFVYLERGNPRAAAAVRLAEGVRSAEARQFLEFFAGGRRGVARARTAAAGEGGGDAG